MADLLDRAIDSAAEAGSAALVLAAFVLAFAETGLGTDLVVPGEVGMVLVGAVTSRVDVWVVWVIVAATVGATLGDSFGWWLGSRFGTRWLARFPRLHARLRPNLDRAERYFTARGGMAVFLGRFVGALRGVVAFVAGAAGMPYRRFLPWNVLASLCWVSAVVLAGYFFGRNVDAVVGEVTLAIGATIVVLVVIAWLLRGQRSRRGGTARP
jgi:undecaprenyl-diphosphatase